MKTFVVTMTKDITVSFDETDPKFQEQLKGYKEFFAPDATYESFAETIASQVSRYGVDDHVEGVGYLNHNGEAGYHMVNGEYILVEGLVNVDVETDLNSKVDFEVEYTTEHNR